ncbi:hypothetical protein HAX54_007647 [Datura stramonium]|uniref:Secreted protein n=1 Tax=Datura stramonium TaxID=4076 RepID=A0ABS8TEL6_DATST|nr:hypothetical protein [Datura stramonium]
MSQRRTKAVSHRRNSRCITLKEGRVTLAIATLLLPCRVGHSAASSLRIASSLCRVRSWACHICHNAGLRRVSLPSRGSWPSHSTSLSGRRRVALCHCGIL